MPPGNICCWHVQRNGHEERVELVLQTAERAAPPSAEVVWRKMGLRLNPVNAELVSRTNQQLHGGLSVADIRPDSAAGKAGIQRGDILVGLHQWEMLSLDNVVFVLTHADLATFSARPASSSTSSAPARFIAAICSRSTNRIARTKSRRHGATRPCCTCFSHPHAFCTTSRSNEINVSKR